VEAGLEELIGVERDPLIGRLSDGRLRVMDVRKCHGVKFRWIAEAEAFHAWACEKDADFISQQNLLHPYPRTGTNGDKRGPEGTRVPEVIGKRLEGSAAPRRRASSGGVGEAGNDHDVTPQAKEDGPFDGADDEKAASVVWNAFSCECRAFNGHDEPSRLASTAIARGMMGTHEGRVTALAAVWVTIKDTQKKPKEAWATLRERLRNKGGGKRVWQAGRKWAKTFTG